MSESSPIFAVILAAGKGTRMKSNRAKVLHTLCGVPMVNYDGPLISDRTLGELVERHSSAGVGATVLVAELEDPSGLGRVVEDAGVVRIVEERDATEYERQINLVNLGIYAFRLSEIREAIGGLTSENESGELYLTDVLETIGRRSRAVTYRLKNLEEANLVNDRSQLARAEEILRRRILAAHMRDGVTVRDPASTHIEASVEIGRDTVILPGSLLRGETRIGTDCVIGPSTDLQDTRVGDGALVEHSVGRGAEVGDGASVGPYSFLRPATVLEPGAKVGAYCEVKNSRVGAGSKVPHLSYVGDADLGAGTITANYDGENKYRTLVGDGVFTGVNTNLIAPVTVGEDSYTGAGSVVNKDVPAGKLAVGAPARAIRESPQRRRKRAGRDGSAKNETEG